MAGSRTITQLREESNQAALEDSWWVNIDGETQDQRYSLNDLESLQKQYAGSDMMVLHVSESALDDPSWIRVIMEFPKPSQILEQIRAHLEGMESRIDRIEDQQRDSVAGLQALFDVIKNVEDARKQEESLRERETYLAESEEILVQKIHRMEEERAELDQMRSDLEKITAMNIAI
ncbi:hypothetical protein [Cerasicoccus maritimus]|uniref:hypothetical protein n=1 Tax=Cerasicoccus maritimus TaxID=490089 RepID=UPI00285266A2|nr:hypothetical protein [Cerasicoccus maritimus]